MRYLFEGLNHYTITAAAAFVQTAEWGCVNLAEHIRLWLTNPQYNGCKAGALVYREDTAGRYCCGILFLTKGEVLLHSVSPLLSRDVLEAFTAFFIQSLSVPLSLYAVAGGRNFTAYIIKRLHCKYGIQPVSIQEYHLMRCTAAPPELPYKPDSAAACTAVTIEQAGTEDLESLYPLQLAYEEAEVAYKNRGINPSVCRLLLRSRLRTYGIYKIVNGSTAVAKAGINAEGFRWLQIGGVYTVPAYRNKGYAAALIRHIITLKLPSYDGIALFVKKENTAALRVYTKTGFSMSGDFQMCYYY